MLLFTFIRQLFTQDKTLKRVIRATLVKSICHMLFTIQHKKIITSKYRYSRTLVSLIWLSLLAGCASQVKNLPEEAQIDIPEAWEVVVAERSDQELIADELSTEPSADQEVSDDKTSTISGSIDNAWLNAFNDSDLQKYVQIALDNNPDLLASAASLKVANEGVTITGASLLPNVAANLRDSNIRRDEGSLNVNDNIDDNDFLDGGDDFEILGDIEEGPADISTDIRTITGTLNVSWEADIWGRLTQRKKSAVFSSLAQTELFKASELSLVANVTRSWYNLMANKLQLELAIQRLDSFKSTADLIDENYKRGLRSALDVFSSRTDVQTQIASLADTRFNYNQSLRNFKTLLGRYPDTDLEFEAMLPELQDPIPIGLPAELLTRRPDVKASQLQYQAQIASAKAAHRDRYPSISFTGSLSDSRDSFSDLFADGNMTLSLITSITQPIFSAGSLKAREAQALYQAESAYASLVRTTLNAFEEVENTLSREAVLIEQRDALREAVGYAENGFELALSSYQLGIENYTTVLDSQRRLFDSKRNEIDIRNAILQNRINAHLALGGDFTATPRDYEEDLPTALNISNSDTNLAEQ